MYTYGRRRLRDNEFRVLQLGLDNHGSIRGSLDVVTFNSNDQYATLSYVWDHDNLDGSIELCGFTKRISLGLARIIRRLYDSQIRRVWIDQLCINQDDLQERNRQVARMQDIYRGGLECFVYLGEGTGFRGDLNSMLRWIRFSVDHAAKAANGDLAVSILDLYLRRDARFHPARSSTNMVADCIDGNLRDLLPCHRCIDYITAQDYWHRGWVVQELLSSRRVYCLIGDEEFSWEAIRSLAFDVPIIRSSEANTAALRKIRATNAVDRSEERAWTWSWDSNLEARSADNLRAFNRFMGLLEVCRDQNLVSLLQSARMLKTSDPRDKVFAMLSLASDAADYPEADYTLTKEQVYRLYADCMIRNGHGTSVLAASPSLGGSVYRRWPTWTPRWNHTFPEFSWNTSTTFSAGGLQPARFHCNGQTTRVSAFMYDSIHFRSTALHVRSDRVYTEMAQFVDGLVTKLTRSRTSAQSSSYLMKNIVHLLLCDPTSHPGSTFLQDSGASKPFLYKLEKGWNDWNFALHDTGRDEMQTTQNGRDLQEMILARDHHFWFDSWKSVMGDTGTEKYLRKLIGKHLKRRGLPYFNCLVGKDHASMCVVTLRSRQAAKCDETAHRYVMGLAPATCRPGDKVAIIKGARAPFILRRRASGEYWNLGQAYIRGVMRGEVVKGLKKDDFWHIDIV
ncbi:uncharacterized protein AB675_11890 [Cyphellophora attinorum]|uniref:Heterokaryon incompatibility domain-containing protein n=1 Tax=Cyphellophora attinorum TaxID=1664694 RepID=A0A0N0NHR2_9EURO|nr:uncharacterized protein AB675_11890 [Phialophora attinorum]KPI34981.1 hypothetical protein AB675_11890 [Phialophora attinorum]